LLFNSYAFILVFLPFTFVVFWYGGRTPRWRLAVVTLASYAFYSAWQFDSAVAVVRSLEVWRPGGVRHLLWPWRFTLVMFAGTSVDYLAAGFMSRLIVNQMGRRRLLLFTSLAANLGLLGFFKYAGFFSEIASSVSRLIGGGAIPVVAVVLPVGISFYTFESISYVVDVYRDVAKPARSLLDYACFISFFPHLLAGPIIRWSDILHQFRDQAWMRRAPDWPQVHIGLLLFTMGLAKKLVIADRLAKETSPLWAHFQSGGTLGPLAAWAAVLGYTFRIYFDFSGYSDMATGLGHLFAVRLPQNFNSPYKASNPSDFWRRWHITLSCWLRDYLFIPLGGSRNGVCRTLRNLMITLVIGGLWHGAGWLFVIWGAWHGLLLAGFHLLRARGWWPDGNSRAAQWSSRQLTFLAVVIGWVFFRTADLPGTGSRRAIPVPAIDMFREMIGTVHKSAFRSRSSVSPVLGGMIVLCWTWCNFMPNSFEVAYGLKLRRRHAALAGATLGLCALHLGARVEFLYFRF
jgi:D-alanyl-lipoteichoic acid acyltransferase DltB (MBOAT superfamily)